MKRFATFLGVCLTILALLTPLSYATQIKYMSPEKMGEVSSDVVRGKVASVRSFWNESGTKILTETVVAVDETYKGSAGGSVRVLQLGGVVDNLRMNVHGTLSWQEGEEVLLFLEPSPGDAHRVAGFSQGKFAIERHPKTGEMLIQQPATEGAEVVGGPVIHRDSRTPRPKKIPLHQFIQQTLGQ